VSAARDILSDYQHVVESLTLTTGSGGVFDVTVDGELLYSKGEEGRHAEPGEVVGRFEDRYGEGVSKYGDD
jgi:predicted Rdx family selenoprotein